MGPKYGFEGSQSGVIEMLHAAASFNENEEYSRNRDRLNQLLGFEASANDRTENETSVSKQPESVQKNDDIEIVARHVFEDVELKLKLPKIATFHDVKKAISKC